MTQEAARKIDRDCKANKEYLFGLRPAPGRAPSKSWTRAMDMTAIAVAFLTRGAPPAGDGVLHRLAKFDTDHGLASLRYASENDVPYAVLLYERCLGRPFAGHRDAVSELVGEVMENAVEDILRTSGVTYRKTKRAERIPGFGQAPDFCIPDEVAPVAVIEAKITSDDGTARDKVARIKNLVADRDHHVAEGKPSYEVIAAIDGRGFRVRREDMRQLILALNGKVFTTATLASILTHSSISALVPDPPEDAGRVAVDGERM